MYCLANRSGGCLTPRRIERPSWFSPGGRLTYITGIRRRNMMDENSTNPQNPRNLEAEAEQRTPRFTIVGIDFIIASAILGGFAGLLFPTVEAARSINGLGPFFPDLMWLHQRTFPLPIIVSSVALSLLSCIAFWALRLIVPAGMLRYFPWRQRRSHSR